MARPWPWRELSPITSIGPAAIPDRPDRQPPAPRSLLAMWHAMPLTAQLSVVGMLVAIAWFLTAQASGDRQHARGNARIARLARLHGAELLTARLGASIESMTAAQRGFIVSGAEEMIAPFDVADRTFRSDAAALRQRAVEFGIGTDDLDQVERLVLRWQAEVARPNVALRREAGLGPFGGGGVGAARLSAGAVLLDSARARLAEVRARVRNGVLAAQAEIEEGSALDDLEALAIMGAAVLIFMLLGVLLLRVVSRALNQVIVAAEALEEGRYREARLPPAELAPNRELALLSRTFDEVADSIEARERQLQDDIEKLKELERLKTDFVSTVSHELRTPLTSMRGALGLMLGGKVGEIPGRGRDLLQIAMTNTERLIRLINDILDIEKIDAGHVTIRHDRVTLRPLLVTTVAGVESFARDHKVSLDLAPGGDAVLTGDADRLVQVFTNLISNAVKFSPAGATVEVSAEVRADSCTVRIRDHGPGIPPEFAGRIFGRFQQAEGADARKQGGTGLGLSIARAITELHGGSIGFEAAPGGGTTFWVALPTAPPVTAETDVRRAVLIIEDDAMMRDVLSAHVEAFARPIAVPSAEAALEVLRTEEVAAIVLDPGLPGMSGLEFAKGLRSDPRLRTMPVFVFTAMEHPPEALRAAGVRAGDAYVKSRDSEEALFERIKTTIRTRR